MLENNNESWKDVKEYEGLYQVSTLGRIRSLRYKKVMLQAKGKRWIFKNMFN